MLLSLVLAAVLGSPDAAAANAPGPAGDPPAPAESTWYGGPATALGVTALPLALAGAIATRSTVGLLPGLGLFTLVGPINHGLNHEPGRAMASLVLRVAASAATYGSLSALAHGNCGKDQPDIGCDGLFVLAFLGPPIVAMIVDDGFLARTAPPARPIARGPSFAPAVSFGTNAASLALAGVF